jgi:hypothetical protein
MQDSAALQALLALNYRSPCQYSAMELRRLLVRSMGDLTSHQQRSLREEGSAQSVAKWD